MAGALSAAEGTRLEGTTDLITSNFRSSDSLKISRER